jgi:C-terminal processing protease CtpA/Prc
MRPLKHFPRASVLAYALSVFTTAVFLFAFGASPARAQQQGISGFDRSRARQILDLIKNDIRKNYYDDKYRSIDLEARFKDADEKLKAATSIGHAWGIIAQVLVDFDDSHTFFIPPSRPAKIEYGWQMKVIGDKCFVSAVKPGSDAEKKGLQVGDEVWSIDGFGPVRENIWKIKYFYYSLRPHGGMRLVIRKPDGKEQELDVLTKVTEGKKVIDLTNVNEWWKLNIEAENDAHFYRNRYAELGDDLIIWKMPDFEKLEDEIDSAMGKIRGHKAAILDLRGNPGGYVMALERLAGYFFDHDVKIAELKGRKEMKPQMAKTRGDKMFKGQVVVLVDSESASAAEIFARLMQIEKRATILGDRSAGAVMQSRVYGHESGVDIVAFWAVSVTMADVVMGDGKSLERVGVAPDELILPNAADMAAGRDPVLARAAELVGVKLDPAKAGSLFPVEWKRD